MESYFNDFPVTLEKTWKSPRILIQLAKYPTLWHNIPMLNYLKCTRAHEGLLARYRGIITATMLSEKYTAIIVYTKQKLPIIPTVTVKGKYRESVPTVQRAGYVVDKRRRARRFPMMASSVPCLNEWVKEFEMAETKRALAKYHPTTAVLQDDADFVEIIPRPVIVAVPNDNIIIKLYKSSTLEVGHLIEAIGFLSFADNVYQPILHVLEVNRVFHMNPLIDYYITPPLQETSETALLATRYELHKLLSLCLLNDDVAANYLLCYLVSTISCEYFYDINKLFNLNISNIPINVKKSNDATNCPAQLYGEYLTKVLHLLVPASYYFQFTIPNLNSMRYIPGILLPGFSANQLMKAMLRLKKNTYLVVDETRLMPGTLCEHSIHVFRGLSHVMEKQTVPFVQVDVPLSLSCLVLSDAKSTLPTNVAIPLAYDQRSVDIVQEQYQAVHFYLKQQNRLNRFRKYLTFLGKVRSTSSVNEIYKKNFRDIDLNLQEHFMRLIALTYGKNYVDDDVWNTFKELEAERLRRRPPVPQLTLATNLPKLRLS